MIGARFHDGTFVEYPDANMILTDTAPSIDFVNRDTVAGTCEVIATLDAKDIKEIYDEGGTKDLAA